MRQRCLLLVAGGGFFTTLLASDTSRSPVQGVLYDFPLTFEENRGQAESRFDYVARGPGYGLYLSGGEILFGLRRGSDRIFILEVHVDEGLSGPFLNTVEAAAEGDQDAENNSSTAPAVAAAPGNANADGAFNAADIVLLVLEINDGDGEDVFAADGGTFQGNPTMDVDGDGLITLADYDALVLLIFPPSGTP